MSWRDRGGRNMAPPAEYSTYDDSGDAYGQPKKRVTRPQQQNSGDRGQRFDVAPLSTRQRHGYQDEASYGYQASADQRSYRAPYATNNYRSSYDHQRQQPETAQPGAVTERGTRWSGGHGHYQSGSGGGPMSRPPSSGSGYAGRGSRSRSRRSSGSGGGGGSVGASGSGSGGGGSCHGGNGRAGSAGSGINGGGGFIRYLSNPGRQPSAAVAQNVGAACAASGFPSNARVRAPYMATVGSSDQPEQPATDTDVPSNPNFITPAFPQAPRTRTDSCNSWALMIEAGCQTLEAVVGPFLEGVLIELFGECWERELYNLGLSLPPFTAATCVDLVSRCKQLHERLPITIHKRVEAVGKATAALTSNAASLEPEDVTAAQTAMKGMLQDCIKAVKIPSLLGAGSRQFRAFTSELIPHAESNLLYYEMLLVDCSEAAAARQQVRAAAAQGSEGSVAAGLEVPAATS
ncbi:hypothetical protein VaNZ11_001473 [Volvox africanus]|uniref:Uncharacterized protein n=1 Tax=Volvox africanus TaxID=51714 RepID=A0ABQ5RPT2_9CHLO|nr:hypothetical protein VaNZ11_001473 [Volvox africanus]